MSLDLVQTLSELIAIPSVNPMGRDVSGPEFFEGRVTDYLESLFRRLGLPMMRQTVEPGRDNIVARLDGDRPLDAPNGLLLFEAHQDTVPVDGMTIPPWTPTVRDGRIYGRGSCDIKGGMAAMLGALARLAEERPRGMPTLIMACTVNEEHGFSGASRLTELWKSSGGKIVPRRPDAAVVAEPTSLDVVVAHKGAVRWRVHTRGRAVHSSQPQTGDNAVYKMARVLGVLEEYARDVVPHLAEHPLCGRPTMSVGLIRGGLSVNTVPDYCTIEVDRRIVPGEEPSAAYAHVVDHVARDRRIDFPVEHEEPYLRGRNLPDGPNAELAERLSAVARGLFGAGRKVGVPYGTNASSIAAAGVPSVVFGPGSIDQAHTADEWLALDQLASASQVLFEFARGGW